MYKTERTYTTLGSINEVAGGGGGLITYKWCDKIRYMQSILIQGSTNEGV